jgi:hypothetical protein
MDRVHRIGQKRPVKAIRFIMDGSIEERFINLQNAKEALGKGSLQKLKQEDRQRARLTAMKGKLVVIVLILVLCVFGHSSLTQRFFN